MKKVALIILLICVFTIKNVKANSIDVIVDCPSTVYVGEQIVCNIYSNTHNVSLTGIKGNYEFINGNYSSFKVGNDWVKYLSTKAGFVIGNTDGGIIGKSLLGSFTVVPTVGVGDNVTIKITNLNASDVEYNDYDISSKQTTINVVEKTIPKEVEINNTISSSGEIVLLDLLEVEGYSISFEKDKFTYELEVDESINSINILATSKNNKVSGTGKFELKNDENIFKISVKGEEIERIYTVIIKKVNKLTRDVENNESIVEKALDKYDSVNINLIMGEDALIAYQRVVEKIFGKNKTIVYNVYKNEKILYSYVFDGTDMDYIMDNMNLEILYSSDEVRLLLKDVSKNNMILDMKYRGFFPKGTTLRVYNVKVTDKDSVKLYKVNSKNKLELVKSNIKFKDNVLEFNIDKGELYILDNVKEKNRGSIKVIIFVLIGIIIGLVGFFYGVYKYGILKNKF